MFVDEESEEYILGFVYDNAVEEVGSCECLGDVEYDEWADSNAKIIRKAKDVQDCGTRTGRTRLFKDTAVAFRDSFGLPFARLQPCSWWLGESGGCGW